MKRIIFLADGASDWPIAAFGNKTPLQAADLPNMDRIARNGRGGIFHTIQSGMPNGSATANLGVFGYDARALFGTREGRGVLEAASMGIEIGAYELAMRINLIGLDGEKIKTHSSGHITSPEAAELILHCDAKLGLAGVKLHPGVSYRHLLVLKGGDENVDCAPPHDNIGRTIDEAAPRAETPEAEDTARRLREIVAKSREVLRGHPVNVARAAAGKQTADALWPWAPGRKPKMQTFQERFGVTGAVISAVDLIFGVGVLAGLEKIEVEGATGLYDTNYEGKAQACIDALNRVDFVFVHVEASDEAGHEKNAELKKTTLEYLDKRIIGPVLDYLEKNKIEAVVAVLPDHPTPVATGAHVTEPVPVAIWDPRVPADKVRHYDEESVKGGGLGEMRGAEFIEKVMA